MAKLRIAHIASEVTPLAKTGGLADVVGSLPKELEKLGHKVAVFMPYYREVRMLGKVAAQPVLQSLPVHLAPGLKEEISLLQAQLPNSRVTVYFVANARAYDRDNLYGTPEGDYPDNAERFILLCRGVLQSIAEMKTPFDILHCHDWQTALIPAYINHIFSDDPVFARTASVFTIHNMAYQGLFPKDTIVKTGLGWDFFTPERLEFYGRLNLMKAGILYANKVTTVSPTYGREILTPEMGFGLEGLLKIKQADLTGILNGIDEQDWDPSRDPHIRVKFSRQTLAGKAACKTAVRQEMELEEPEKERTMLIGAVARLAEQKGFNLLVEAASKLAKRPLQIAVLGSGDPTIQDMLDTTFRDYPGKFGARFKFDNPMAHRIYAGADALLIPSRFEPCGLGQMIAMRYGTLPIVRATGGLVDTVKPINSGKKQGTGFVFKPFTTEGLVKAIDEALAVFADEQLWKKLVGQAMAENFSWGDSAKKYEEVYTQAIEKQKRK
jgi:starch synthase